MFILTGSSIQVGYLVTKIRLGYKNLRVQKATANFAAGTKESFITLTLVVNAIKLFFSLALILRIIGFVLGKLLQP